MEYRLTQEDILVYALAFARNERDCGPAEDREELEREIAELEHRLEQPGAFEAFQSNGLHVERLSFKSTDCFLVNFNDNMTREQMIYIRDYVRGALGVKNVLVIDNTVTLAIMGREDEQDT